MAVAVRWSNVPYLTPGMKNLGNQINERFPNRSGTSDGAVGDYAHSQGTSGHNPDDTVHDNAEWDSDSDTKKEIRAIDVDKDLNDSRGADMMDLIYHLKELRNLSSVIRYMIYNKKMYHVNNGFEPETYSGNNAHTEHAHFSGAWSQSSDENGSFDFKLEQLGVRVATQFNAEDRVILKADATGGVLSYAGSGLPSWEDQPNNRNFLNAFTALFNLVKEIDGKIDALEAKINNIQADADGIPAAVWSNPTRTLTEEDTPPN